MGEFLSQPESDLECRFVDGLKLLSKFFAWTMCRLFLGLKYALQAALAISFV